MLFLLLAQSGKGDPLAHPRLTVICEAQEIARDSDRDYFMSADEAQTYGLIDQVLTKRG